MWLVHPVCVQLTWQAKHPPISKRFRSGAESRRPEASCSELPLRLPPPPFPKSSEVDADTWSWRGSPGDRAAAAAAWAAVRARAVAPVLEAAVWACLAMSVMLVLEVCYMSVASFVAVNLLRRTPERRYRWEPMPSGTAGGQQDDEEAAVGSGGGEAYPMVLVQIPMYNEREVYKLSIGAACALTWPLDRIIIQVLDDSTDPFIK
ncbi:hypothetical protein BDA96_01G522500 [Sorghum bicolor]|uniref:Glycosyltransferase 2-like domain-containing protein n=1 Tax=Sorghum bicolor TaxID=4558 RepID=A0A921S6H4_SORBI|nr:hypothetical protein BDA96_01G522500 [Sorghum bicolor]